MHGRLEEGGGHTQPHTLTTTDTERMASLHHVLLDSACSLLSHVFAPLTCMLPCAADTGQ